MFQILSFKKRGLPFAFLKREGEGFTLVELVIAIFILAAGILVVFAMFPVGIQIMRSSKMSTVAAHLGEAKIEEIISMSYEKIPLGIVTENYEEISGFGAYKRVIMISCVDPNLEEVACDYDPINNPDPIKKIEAAVFWKSALKVTEKNIELLTLISKK